MKVLPTIKKLAIIHGPAQLGLCVAFILNKYFEVTHPVAFYIIGMVAMFITCLVWTKKLAVRRAIMYIVTTKDRQHVYAGLNSFGQPKWRDLNDDDGCKAVIFPTLVGAQDIAEYCSARLEAIVIPLTLGAAL